MPERDDQSTGHMQEGASLLALLPSITRAMHGLVDEQAIFDATASIMAISHELLLVLRLSEDEKRLRIAAASIGENVARALELFIGGPLSRQRRNVADMPTLSEVLLGNVARTASVSSLCKESFHTEVAGKVAGLLGGGASLAILCPLLSPTDDSDRKAIGVLCVVAPHPNDTHIAATAQLSEVVSMALAMAQVMRNVRRARSTLSADHAAQHSLGAAMRIYGSGTPQGMRSVIPRNPAISLKPPPSSQDSWLPKDTASIAPMASNGARVLLVEDEDRVRKSTVALLSGLGYRVEGVATGEHAIATYTRAQDQQAPFAVVLLDQTLSGQIGGVETLRILRSVDPGVRAILLSGQDPARGRQQVDRFGFQQCLEKPVSVDVLSSAIEDTLATTL